MSDNEFLQTPPTGGNKDKRVADIETTEPTAIEGKEGGLFARFSQKLAGGKPKEPSEAPADADASEKPKKGLSVGAIVAIAAVGLVLVLGLIIALVAGGKDEPAPVNQQPDVAQTEQVQQGDPTEQSALPAGQPTDTRDYYVAHTVRAGLPADHWAKAADPIGTLTTMAVERAMVKIPEWNAAVSGVNITSGVTYAGNSFEFSQLKSQVSTQLAAAINNDVQIQNDPNGQPVILERASPQAVAAGGPEFDVIKTATAYDTIATNAEMLAAKIWSDNIAQARMMIPPPAPEPAPAPVDTGISAAQRAEYNRLLQEADAWQKELVRENKRKDEELAAQQKQMVEVLQKVEDNPTANNNMRARMLSTATNMKVQAIQGDLVFLEDKNGKIHSYRIGDALPNTDLVISSADANTGLVYVTKK